MALKNKRVGNPTLLYLSLVFLIVFLFVLLFFILTVLIILVILVLIVLFIFVHKNHPAFVNIVCKNGAYILMY